MHAHPLRSAPPRHPAAAASAAAATSNCAEVLTEPCILARRAIPHTVGRNPRAGLLMQGTEREAQQQWIETLRACAARHGAAQAVTRKLHLSGGDVGRIKVVLHGIVHVCEGLLAPTISSR
jgi:hypothetical protein